MASAKQIRDEIMKMTIVVNSNPAQQAIYDLTKKNRELTEQTKQYREERQKVASEHGRASQQYKDLTEKINQNSQSITANNRKIKEWKDSLDISQMSVKQLREEAVMLKRELDRVVPGSKQYVALQEQLGKVNGRLKEVKNGAETTQRSFRSLAEQFNHYSGIVTAFVAVMVGFGISVQNIIDRNNKMADAMSGVEKTTGMARAEVQRLTSSFSEFDTRTKKIDLLKIAEMGGRLGVAKEEISDFVREVDKANVALGDAWDGGVEKIAESLGKVTTLYSQTRDLPIAESINQIGSAVNELGAAGAASEQNITEFATRVGALPEALKPTIAESLALGAGFEESGINAERAGTAFSNFVSNAAKNVDLFAKVMRVPVQEVKDLINSDPTEFFLKFSEGMKGMDATEVAQILDYLKMNDQYIRSIVGAASENTDRFRASIELSNDSLQEATSLQTEFNKVNNNAAAVWEKLQRKIAEAFTSQYVARFLEFSVRAFALFVGVSEEAEGKLDAFGKTILTVTRVVGVLAAGIFGVNAVIATYNLLLKESLARTIALEAITKVQTATLATQNAVRSIWNTIVGVGQLGVAKLTHAIGNNISSVRMQTSANDMATAAQNRLNLAMKANPIGIIITLIGLAVTAYFAYKSIVGESAEKQKSLNDIMKEGTANAAEEITTLDMLYKKATNVKLSMDERLAAVRKLKAEFPGYFGQINDEIILNGQATKSYHQLRDAIVASSKARAAKEELDRRNAGRLQEDETWREDYKNEVLEIDRLKKDLKRYERDGTLTGNRRLEMLTRIEQKEKSLDDRIKDGIEVRKKRQKEDEFLIKNIERNEKIAGPLNQGKEEVKSDYFVPGATDTSATTTKKGGGTSNQNAADQRYERELQRWKDRGDRAVELARQIELDISDAEIEAMEEGYEKKKAVLDNQEQRKLADIDKNKITQNEFDQLDEKIKTAKEGDKKFFEQLKASWQKNNEDLEKHKESQKILFENKRRELEFKTDNENLQKEDEEHQRKIAKLQREYHEEIAQYETLEQLKAGLRGRMSDEEIRKIRTWAEGKEAVQKVYLQQELDLHIAHLQAMVDLFEGLDLTVLTQEQQEQMLKFIEDAGNKLAEMQAKKAGTNQTEDKNQRVDFSKRETSVDILGMSLDDWDLLFTNLETGNDKIGTLVATIGILKNAFGEYYQFVEANEKRQLQIYEYNTNAKKNSLKRQLDEGYINQETFKKLTLQAEEDLEKKKAEIAAKQAKRERAMQIASIITNTAQAIMSIWAQFPKFDFGATAAIMSGVVGALGAVQLATVMRQPLPSAAGYEEGFGMEYPIRREQDGKVFNVRRRRLSSMLVDRPTHFIAGERGVEMVIDNPTWTSYSPGLKSAIHQANARAKGFEGGFNASGESVNDELMIKMMALIQQNTEVMDGIRRKGISAYIAKTARNGKHAKEMIQEFDRIDNKNIH